MKYKMRISYHTIQLFSCIFVLLWINAGNFSLVVDKVPAVIKLGTVGMWFLFTYLSGKEFIARFIKIGWPIIIFDFLLFFSKILFYMQGILEILIKEIKKGGGKNGQTDYYM